MIQAVLFDYYFTLADPDAVIDDHDLLAVWRSQRRPDVDRDPERFALLGDRWAWHSDELRTSREASHAVAPAYAEVAGTIEALRARGLLVGVLSDADCWWLHASIEHNALPFDAVVCSEDLRCYKPHPRMFEAACDALGVAPSAAMYVGDTPRLDIVGARDAGLTPVWINRRNLTWPDELDPPAHVVDALDELLTLLGDP